MEQLRQFIPMDLFGVKLPLDIQQVYYVVSVRISCCINLDQMCLTVKINRNIYMYNYIIMVSLLCRHKYTLYVQTVANSIRMLPTFPMYFI